jgi:N6-adenosine-specific RNA methylase IME4
MEGREKSHMDKYKESTKDWNYDASCMLTSLPVSDLENFKCLIFVAQTVHDIIKIK